MYLEEGGEEEESYCLLSVLSRHTNAQGGKRGKSKAMKREREREREREGKAYGPGSNSVLFNLFDPVLMIIILSTM